MPPDSETDQRIRTFIASARQAAAGGWQQRADMLLRQAESLGPRHPLVLNETAMRMLASENVEGAAGLLQEIVEAEPTNPELWFNLSAALRKLNRIDEALAALDRSLELQPHNASALLEKGSLEELLDHPRAAAMAYRTALQMIPPGANVPPAMEAALRHARQAVDLNNRALEAYLVEGLRDVKGRFPDMAFKRFDQCVDIILQKRGIFRQQPTFLFFPELPAIEFYEPELFPWLQSIEAAADDIRAELLDVLSEGTGVLEPYVTDRPMEKWRELNNSRRWGVYFFWSEGKAFPEHIARCPRTVRALEAWPRWDVPDSGPTAMFSILDANSRIPAHTGPVNTRLTVHLPLIVPPGCGFRVGGQTREWVAGKAFVFDDSISHEAWNDSDLPRAVMIFDIWTPHLTEAERELTRVLTGRIGEYYGTRSNRVA